MSLSFTDAAGTFFNRLGKIFGAFKGAEHVQASNLPVLTNGITDQFDDDLQYIANVVQSEQNAQSSLDLVKSDYQQMASDTLIGMVNADTPLSSPTESLAIAKLIQDMNGASATVNANRVGISVSTNNNNSGNGTCYASVIGVDGKSMENVYEESLAVTCTQDSQPGNGNTQVGSETFLAQGAQSVDSLNFNWPGGSGGNTTIILANAAIDGAMLTNGDFESFTSNTPDNWTVVTGTAGTTVKSTSTSYNGSSALELVGTSASERTRLSQNLRDAPTTPGSITPLTKYLIAAYVRVSAVPSVGTLRIALRNGTGDGAEVVGGASITIDLSSATTDYVIYHAEVNTPIDLSDELDMVVELTEAIDSGKSVYIDDVTFSKMAQHQKGPFIAIVPGNSKFVKGDGFTLAVTNDYDGKIQTMFNRIFGMDQIPALLPSDIYGDETISDALISQ